MSGQGSGCPVTVSTMSWIGFGALPVNASTASTATTAVAATPIAIFPRWVSATENLLRCQVGNGKGSHRGPAFETSRRSAVPNHPMGYRRERHISSRRRMRSAKGGWVENRRSIAPSLSPSRRDG